MEVRDGKLPRGKGREGCRREEGDYRREERDYRREEGQNRSEIGDYSRRAGDYRREGGDYRGRGEGGERVIILSGIGPGQPRPTHT